MGRHTCAGNCCFLHSKVWEIGHSTSFSIVGYSAEGFWVGLYMYLGCFSVFKPEMDSKQICLSFHQFVVLTLGGHFLSKLSGFEQTHLL